MEKEIKVFEKSEDKSDEEIMNKKQHYGRKRSLWLVCCSMIFFSLTFGISITGAWPYLLQLKPDAEKSLYGYVISAYPVGQLLCSMPLGLWSDHLGSIRIPQLLSSILLLIGGATYALLPIFPEPLYIWIIVARFLIGASAANATTTRCYVTKATTLKERSVYMGIITGCQSLGFAFGPGIQAVLTLLGLEGYHLWGPVYMNTFTTVGWISALIGVVSFFVYLPCCFTEFDLTKDEKVKASANITKSHSENAPVLFLEIFVFFVVMLNFVFIETLSTPLAMDMYAWTESNALLKVGIVLTAASLVNMLVFVTSGKVSAIIDERKVMVSGLLLLLVSLISLQPIGNTLPKIASSNTTIAFYDSTVLQHNITEDSHSLSTVGCPPSQEWCLWTPIISQIQLLSGGFGICIGYAVGVTTSISIFSKMLSFDNQGIWLGVLTGMGCLARIIGPITVGYLYVWGGPRWVFGVFTLLVLFTIALVLVFYNRLVPYAKTTETPSDVYKTKKEEASTVQQSNYGKAYKEPDQ